MGQRSLLNAGSNPAGLNGYSPLELLKESSMATLQREASRMGGGMISDPNMQDRFSFSVMAPPPSRADMMMGGEQVMGMMPMAGITAFHGSPHKFTKFDMSKIGTGEGAQAYGHGLYMAENPNVANEYADKLATLKGHSVNLDGIDIKQMAHYSDEPSYVQGVEKKYNKGVAEVVKQIQDEGYMQTRDTLYNHKEDLKGAVFPTHGYDSYEDLLYRYVFAEHKISENVALNRNLYKVDIPDDQIAKMLDWDKPLSEQVGKVKGSLLRDEAGGDYAYREWPGSAYEPPSGKTLFREGYTGEDGWQGLVDTMGEVKASEYLHSQGIPGIKYLDAGSRSGGQGTSNFVLFSDDIAKILERNDQPIGLIHGR